MKLLLIVVLTIVLPSAMAQGDQTTVLFVCEHGAAKSIVASSHFERLAREQGLNVHIVARGINPDKSIPQSVTSFLADDSLQTTVTVPKKLSKEDLNTADYIITFNPIPPALRKPGVEYWEIPSFEAGYPAARDSILVHLNQLVKKIKADRK